MPGQLAIHVASSAGIFETDRILSSEQEMMKIFAHNRLTCGAMAAVQEPLGPRELHIPG